MRRILKAKVCCLDNSNGAKNAKNILKFSFLSKNHFRAHSYFCIFGKRIYTFHENLSCVLVIFLISALARGAIYILTKLRLRLNFVKM